MRRLKITFENRKKLVKDRLAKRLTLKELEEKYGIAETTIYRLLNRYNKHGVEGLKPAGDRNRIYTIEFKNEILERVFSGDSIENTSIHYKIPDGVVRNWIKQYNNNQMNDYVPNGEIYIMKTKKYTQEEKYKIIKECIDSNKDYKSICNKYSIKYS